MDISAPLPQHSAPRRPPTRACKDQVTEQADSIDRANRELRGKTPEQIISWTLGEPGTTLVTTSFGPFSAVMLHAVTRVRPDQPIAWVDSGYNTRETYQYAEDLTARLNLNLHVFIPEQTAARRDALLGGIPPIDSELHAEFTRQVKLEPFQRVIAKFRPDYWLTALRKDETEFRRTLDIASKGPNGIIKIAPFLDWTEVDMENYLYEHGLPQVGRYFDPTKGESTRECGLHTLDFSI